jgi:hypothetical protein
MIDDDASEHAGCSDKKIEKSNVRGDSILGIYKKASK